MIRRGTPLAAGLVALFVVGSSVASPPRRGIEVVHGPADPLSFCQELHSGFHGFQIRLRNRRGVRTRVTISVEGGAPVRFVLPADRRINMLRGPWNGKYGAKGCRMTIAWDHTRFVVALPLAQE